MPRWWRRRCRAWAGTPCVCGVRRSESPQASPDAPRTGLALRLAFSGYRRLRCHVAARHYYGLIRGGSINGARWGSEVSGCVSGNGKEGDGGFAKETVRWGRQLRSCHLDASAPGWRPNAIRPPRQRSDLSANAPFVRTLMPVSAAAAPVPGGFCLSPSFASAPQKKPRKITYSCFRFCQMGRARRRLLPEQLATCKGNCLHVDPVLVFPRLCALSS
jgi:hypothetical protein